MLHSSGSTRDQGISGTRPYTRTKAGLQPIKQPEHSEGYPTPKELAWIKDLADVIQELGDERMRKRDPRSKELWKQAQKLTILYKYLLWSYRYGKSHGMSIEHQIDYGFVVKYHRKLYGIEPDKNEKLLIEKSEKAYAEYRRERKRQKNTDRGSDLRTVRQAGSRQHQSRERLQRRGKT